MWICDNKLIIGLLIKGNHTKSPETIVVANEPFQLYIPREAIDARVELVAEQLLDDYDGLPVQFLHVAMGGVFFATELSRAMRKLDPGIDKVPIRHNLSRLTLWGPNSGSQVVRDLANFQPVDGKHVIVVDEVVRTGKSARHLLSRLGYDNGGKDSASGLSTLPASLSIATLIDKPDSRITDPNPLHVNYAASRVPTNTFLIGRGMDIKGFGRELDDIYQRVGPEDEPALAGSYTLPFFVSPFGR